MANRAGSYFPKKWPLSNPNRTQSIMNKHKVKQHRNSETCIRVFQQSPTQTGLHCHRRWQEALYFGFRKLMYCTLKRKPIYAFVFAYAKKKTGFLMTRSNDYLLSLLSFTVLTDMFAADNFPCAAFLEELNIFLTTVQIFMDKKWQQCNLYDHLLSLLIYMHQSFGPFIPVLLD